MENSTQLITLENVLGNADMRADSQDQVTVDFECDNSEEFSGGSEAEEIPTPYAYYEENDMSYGSVNLGIHWI